jgi:hypothetical protein
VFLTIENASVSRSCLGKLLAIVGIAESIGSIAQFVR